MSYSLQIQTVLYHNEKSDVLRTLRCIANAIRVSRNNSDLLGKVFVAYGDASKEPVYTDGEIQTLKNSFKDYFEFKYVFFNENTGTSKGHNKLAENLDTDYMIIMNPDVVFIPEFFENIFAPFLDESKNAGIVEARQTPIEHPKEYDKETFKETWASMACSMMPTELYHKIGGFDEKTFFMYCDDVDISFRTRLFGKEIYYCPDAVVFHAKRFTSDGKWSPTNAELYYSAEASLLMAYKWSNDKLLKSIYNDYLNSDKEYLIKAANKFKQLKDEGNLPERLDRDHKIAVFEGLNYSKHRYLM